jgi:predicted enzyme related to lactoylglutathione lyase
MDAANNVGYRLGNQEFGLDPNGFELEMTDAPTYDNVSDIKKSQQTLREAGAQVVGKTRDVGGGKLVAAAKDMDRSRVGLIQMP